MASGIQLGWRRLNKSGQEPSSRTVTVLNKKDWQRIQDELTLVDKDQEQKKEARRQREALHLKSKEMVKQWPNSFAAQREKKLEAKKIREQMEEEQRKLDDLEEQKYKEQRRKEAIEEAKTQLYYQTDRVKGLHSALLLTEVLKEREAQIQLKQRMKNLTKDVDQEYLKMMKSRDDEALRREQERKTERENEKQAVVEDLRNQMKERVRAKERQELEKKKEGEELYRLQQAHLLKQKTEEEAQARLKRELMQAHQEHISVRNDIKATETQKENLEEEQRQLFLRAKQKMMALRKQRETELTREAEMKRERIMNELSASRQQQQTGEEQRTAQAVAERELRLALLQKEEREKRAAMMESIAAHRERTRHEKEQDEEQRQQQQREALQDKREAARLFKEEQQQKAQTERENLRKIQDFNTSQTVDKRSQHEQLRRHEHDLLAKNIQLQAEDQDQFQQYSKQVIQAALEAQRNVIPLRKAARDGLGAGPSLGAGGPRYLVQDRSGAQMPRHVTDGTQKVKTLIEVADIHAAKKRLGFTWS
ncbi:cilia- and flagella- associated protein 210 [Neosynchiropus ocellatus]